MTLENFVSKLTNELGLDMDDEIIFAFVDGELETEMEIESVEHYADGDKVIFFNRAINPATLNVGKGKS